MKKLLLIIIVLFLSNNTFSQNISMLSFNTPLSPKEKLTKSLINEITNLSLEIQKTENDINVMNKTEKLQNLNTLLSKKVNELELLGTLDVPEEQPKLQVSGNLELTPTSSSNNIISPKFEGVFKEYLLGKDKTDPYSGVIQYQVNLNVNAPEDNLDSLKIVNNILRRGPDGSIGIGLRSGFINIFNNNIAFAMGINGNINWNYTKNIVNNTAKSFGYLNYGAAAILEIKPAIIILQWGKNYVSNPGDNGLAQLINNSEATNLILGVSTQNYNISLTYLIGSNRENKPEDNLQMNFGVPISIF